MQETRRNQSGSMSLTRPGRVLAIGVGVLVLAVGCDRVDTGVRVQPRISSSRGTPPTRPVYRRPPVSLPPPAYTIHLGRSVNGTPLTLHVFGSGVEHVLVFGGIHGSEPTSAALAAALIDHLRTHPQATAGRTVAVLARANPDGLAAGRRTNAHGVDLNRNFPARNWRPGPSHGPFAGSEPETQALIRAVKMIHPSRIVSIHSIARGRHCDNYDGPAREIALRMARHNGYPVRDTMGYPTPGSFGSWAGRDMGLPVITLELPRDLDAAQCWRENAGALLAFIGSPGDIAGIGVDRIDTTAK